MAKRNFTSSSRCRELDDFSQLQDRLNPSIFRALVGSPFNFTKPSSVQSEVLGMLPELARADGTRPPSPDLLVKARTGTGKTIAFLVPAIESRIQRLAALPPDQWSEKAKTSVGCLILSPTRELASQIAAEAIKLCRSIKPALGVQLLIGGASKRDQTRNWLRGRPDIVVATPGRMSDMMDSNDFVRAHVAQTQTLVFDEADTLLDMGFQKQIDDILQQIPSKTERQTFLFSATIPRDVAQIARTALRPSYKMIDTVPPGEAQSVHEHVPQHVTLLDNPADLLPHLARLVADDAVSGGEAPKTIIFCPTTAMTQFVYQIMSSPSIAKCLPHGPAGTRVFHLSSKLTQGMRDVTAKRFRQSSTGHSILVTSDVSARGVDYPGVTRVIQVGGPTSSDVYVHRVGRTGRAGKAGRGDLILFPFEVSRLRGDLRSLPLKPLSATQLQTDLNARIKGFGKLVEGADAATRLGFLREQLTPDFIANRAQDTAEAAFATMCGYFMSRGDGDARGTHDDLRKWAIEGCGLSPSIRAPAALLDRGRKSDRSVDRRSRDGYPVRSYDRNMRGGAPSTRFDSPRLASASRRDRPSGEYGVPRGRSDRGPPSFSSRRSSRSDYDPAMSGSREPGPRRNDRYY